MTKFTDEQQDQIRALFDEGGISMRELGRRYKTSHGTIGRIIRNRRAEEEAGEVYIDANEDLRYAEGNSAGKRSGSLAIRPAAAAAPFDTERSLQANKIRWDSYRDATESEVVKKAQERFGDHIKTVQDAWAAIIGIHVNTAENTPSAKLIGQAIDATPRGGGSEGGTTIDKQQINVYLHRTTGLVANIQELAAKFEAEGKPEVAAYILAQLDEDSEYPQQVEYPIELKSNE